VATRTVSRLRARPWTTTRLQIGGPGSERFVDPERSVIAVASIARLPRPLTEIWDWQRDAACRDLDSAMFFHPDGERGVSRERREERAKAICAGCPVRAQCLEHSLRVEEPYGIWGGMAETERHSRRRRRP
jgi:WhiB family transcriptional regulator, redox-sensing transcriptional regulator